MRDKLRIFKDCIFERSSARLQELLESTSSLPQKQLDELLLFACSHVYKESIELLMQHGAKVDCQDHEGNTPLHLISTVRDHQMGDCLVMFYEEYNVQYDGDFWRDCGERLLEAGANIDIRNKNGELPIHKAAQNWRTRLTLLLAALDPNSLTETDDHGQTPLGIAEANQSKSPAFNYLSKYQDYALHLAATAGSNGTVVKRLMEQGIDPSAQDEGGWTPLHHAASGDYASVAVVLINHGVDVNKGDEDGDTPLHVAASYGHSAFVKLLLDSGADLNVKNNDDKTPLDLALAEAPPEACHAWLESEEDEDMSIAKYRETLQLMSNPEPTQDSEESL